MQKYLDESSILAEAKMMYHDYHEVYILIEGKSDKVFFDTLIGKVPNIRFRPVNGWENVYNAIYKAQDESQFPIAGIIDQDYHLLLQDGIEESEQLFFTDSNDIEMMLYAYSLSQGRPWRNLQSYKTNPKLGTVFSDVIKNRNDYYVEEKK